MHVTELYELTMWIDREIVEGQIEQKYQALHSVLHQNAQPNQQKQPFESQKTDLMEAISNVALDRLTIDQLEFLGKLGIAQHIAENGIETVEDILFKNVIDIATSAENVQEIIQSIKEGINRSNKIKSGLEGCVELDVTEVDEILMRVNFSGHATMSNITDFKTWGNIWYDIIRGVAMAHGNSPEEVRIVGAKKGSIVIELAVIYGIAKTLSAIILEALKVAERALEIRKKAEEIKGLKLTNKKLWSELEKEAEIEKVEGVKNITDNIVKTLSIKTDGEGDKITAMDKSVRNLVDFIEKGGEIDFVIPEEQTSEDEDDEEKGVDKKQAQKIKELRVAFEEIRRLEHKVKQIEQKNP